MVEDLENNEEMEERFEDMVESFLMDHKELKVGDKISGEILSIGEKSIFINTGTKMDGVVDIIEMKDNKGLLSVKAGDTIDLYVVSINEHEIRLSRSVSGRGDIEQLYMAQESKVPVEGKVLETCKGGFRVSLMQKVAFCPVSQIDHRYVENLDEYVGNTYEFLITQISEKGRNIIVSRRELLKRQYELEQKKFTETVKPDDIVEGRVSKIMPYGAFVEIFPGVEGMVHISELSWSRINAPEEAVKVDDRLSFKVIRMEPDTKNQKSLKISLSAKQVSGDPWETVLDKFAVGDKITGKVTRCSDFGAFVEIFPGIEGLVHISEMSHVKRVLRPEDMVRPGENVSVTIKDMDKMKRRISLSIKDAEGDPWLHVETKYPKGKQVTGTVEKKERFGFFVALEPGITGLLPKSKIAEMPESIENAKRNTSITVVIDDIDVRNRKISLAPASASDGVGWKQYADKQGNVGPLGALGAKLQEAMKAKK